MIGGGGLEIAAIGQELMFDFRVQLLGGKDQPQIALGSARQGAGSKGQTNYIGKVMIAAMLGRPFQIMGDMAGMGGQRRGQLFLEFQTEAGAMGGENFPGQHQIGGTDGHIHGAGPLHPPTGWISPQKVQHLIVELGGQPLVRLGGIGQGQMRQVLQPPQFPRHLDVDTVAMAIGGGPTPYPHRPAIARAEIHMPIHRHIARRRDHGQQAGGALAVAAMVTGGNDVAPIGIFRRRMDHLSRSRPQQVESVARRQQGAAAQAAIVIGHRQGRQAAGQRHLAVGRRIGAVIAHQGADEALFDPARQHRNDLCRRRLAVHGGQNLQSVQG